MHEKPVQTLEQAQRQSQTRYCWVVTYLADYSDWDWLWEPPPWQRQYTHVWPSQHHEFSGTYLVPRTGAIQYHFNSKVIPNRHGPARFVTHGHNVDFDYTWAPHPCDPAYIYVFGNQWWPAEKMSTVEYHVPGATERKYMHQPRATLLPRHDNHWHTVIDCEWDYSWCPDPGDPAYIYVFGNQWWSAEKMPTVEYHVPGATERKYMTWPRARLLPNATHWSVPDNIDTAALDFSWRPDPGEPPYIYQFATQHQKTGGPRYTVPGATDVKYMAELQVHTVGQATAVIEIDHLDGNAGKVANATKQVRYFDNYRDTLLRIAKSLVGHHEYVWICSSVCDYSNFDFSWHPEQWQSHMLHVFASDGEKFGDTFFLHVPTFAEHAGKKALLEWYDVNYVGISVPRRPMPVFLHNNDSHVDAVKSQDFSAPLALFTVEQHLDQAMTTVPLWRRETKTITPISTGATAVIVPKVAVADIKTQLYDYAHIDKTQVMLKSQPLDIVFIENGEPNAKSNLLQLQMYLANSVKNTNKLHVVSGVNGRVAAYHAAAQASTTPWFFAVFAKLTVHQEFNWAWQPDRMQQAKHYIFHALNPVNGLTYGHQAMIAYNKRLVLSNPGIRLDFTLDSAHEVVPILSGVAQYNTSAWSTWRTAFREAIKLRASLPDVEAQYRLNQWLTTGLGLYGDISVQGAKDGVDYYESVNGDFDKLKLSYEWAWLASYAFMRRNLTPDH